MAFMNYGGGGGGGQQQMMSMSMSSVSLVACVALGAGAWFMWSGNKSPPPTSAPSFAEVVSTPTPGSGTGGSGTYGTVADGQYNVKYGGLQMYVDADNCTNNGVGFTDTTENDGQVWNFRAVPNRPGYYYVSSEHRLFKKGCDLKYLTAPATCGGTPVLDKPVWADRQYWKLEPSGTDGQYQLKNASCYDKRAESFLTSSGVKAGFNQSIMTSRGGSPYSLNKWTA